MKKIIFIVCLVLSYMLGLFIAPLKEKDLTIQDLTNKLVDYDEILIKDKNLTIIETCDKYTMRTPKDLEVIEFGVCEDAENRCTLTIIVQE